MEGATILKLLGFVLVGAFTGAFTNHLAIKMLFRPLKEWRIFGLRVPFTPGIIPSRINEIIKNLSETVENHLISSKDISQILRKSGYREEIALFIDKVVNEKLGSLVPEELLYPLKVYLSKKVIEYTEQFMDTLTEKLPSRVQISSYIEEKLSKLDLEEMERIILGVTGRELRYITYLGGVLGAIIGLTNYILMVIT